MSRNVSRSAAYCLHSRPYRETSAIVQLFTREAGRISVVARGIKTAGRQRHYPQAVLQLFTPLQVAWSGSGELKTLASMELEGNACFLEGKALFAGLYLNELLNALLLGQQEHGELYLAYEHTLKQLAEPMNLEPMPLERVLRRFERFLLEQLGYGIAFDAVDEQGSHGGALVASHTYRYIPENGFIEVPVPGAGEKNNIFSGEDLCRIAAGQLDSPEVLRAAKCLMRLALAAALGDKTLNSRHLFH
jgi:DNA repair protein RecO (recombination protein O)